MIRGRLNPGIAFTTDEVEHYHAIGKFHRTFYAKDLPWQVADKFFKASLVNDF